MSHSKSRRSFVKNAIAAPMLLTLPKSGSETVTDFNKINSHFLKSSLNVYSFNRPLRDASIDLFDVLDFCAKRNFQAVDPTGYYFPNYPDVPDDGFLMEFKREAFLLGLDISGTGVKNDFVNPDPIKREADKNLVKQWLEVAAKMGSPNLRVFTGRSSYEGESRDEVFTRLAKDLKECCDYASGLGVMVALQNHNEFLKTADDVDRIFEMVGSDWMGLNLDIGSYREKDAYDEVQQSTPHAITWQLKENVFYGKEERKTDFLRMIRIIKNGRYRGYIPIETLGEGDPFVKIPILQAEVDQAIAMVENEG